MKSGKSNLRGFIFIGIAAIATAVLLSVVTRNISGRKEEEQRAYVPDAVVSGTQASVSSTGLPETSVPNAVVGGTQASVSSTGLPETSVPNAVVSGTQASVSSTDLPETSVPNAVVSGTQASVSSASLPETSEQDAGVSFASITESNRKKLENPMDYGPKFCTAYVSTQNDIEVHKAILEEVKALSDELCDGAESDYEKVRRLAYWVADNVYYNQLAAETSVDADTISLETVLKTKTATCAGYSNMFSALCNMQGLYCINLRGGTVYDVFDAEKLYSAPMNHEWNAVLIDGSWVFVDTTWISLNVYVGAYMSSKEYLDRYFDMSLELMSYEHRIDLVDHRDFAASVNAFDENGRWAE